MVRLQLWQWGVLGLPVAAIASFVLVSAGLQIHEWGISWIWAVFSLIFILWRLLLVRWTRPAFDQVEALVAEVAEELEAIPAAMDLPAGSAAQKAEAALQQVIEAARNDPPVWEDWSLFWQRCQDLVSAIAHIYFPDVKYPLLNIYIPQAYRLIRGTVDDMDQWMEKLSPVLNQVTIGQSIEAYEVYRKLEPSARKLWQVWNWAQWVLNPAAAIARRATMKYGNQANQQLLVNLSQLLKEAAFRNLSRQAIALYSGDLDSGNLATLESVPAAPALPAHKTQTLQEILTKAEPVEVIEQKPVNILLVGRTGSGKSSLINTLFVADKAIVDALPSTDLIQDYQWQSATGEALILWDTPGYEQINRGELKEQVLDFATKADLLILATPALDPALQMDVDFLAEVRTQVANLPVITVVTQVDKLRPLREWNPPYDWEWGDRPKEVAIRAAISYRAKQLQSFSDLVLPIVTGNLQEARQDWGVEALSLGLMQAIAPAKQLRLARFLQNQEAQIVAAAKIIDHYTFQVSTTQGLTALLKSPVLSFLSTLATGSPTLAYLLAEKIPVEQLPLVIGKLQLAYDLFNLLNSNSLNNDQSPFDLLSLWTLLLDNSGTPDQNVQAFGHTIIEYWTQSLSIEQFQERFNYYLK